MRRKSSGPKAASNTFNVLRDIDPEKLQTFAGIMIVWNHIETFLDSALGYAMKVDNDLAPHITSRINGVDGKIAIFKQAVALEGASEYARLTISKTLNAVENYKKYRDGIIHVKIPSPTADVADTIQRKGVRDEVLISQGALTGFYDRLCLLQLEMNYLFLLMHFSAMAGLLSDSDGKSLYVTRAQQSLAQLQEAQSRREALPPFPEFPDENPTPSDSEVPQESRG